jgi:glycosyltransferase involved in cell wall biosynthesis
MGQRGRQLVEERYSWEAVARQTAAVYDEVA